MARDVAKGFDYSLVDEVVDIIVKEFSPQKIIIFGSVARKEARSFSDINMLVVMEPTIVGKYPASAPIHNATRKINVPKEIFVVTPSEYETKRNADGSLISMMEDEGLSHTNWRMVSAVTSGPTRSQLTRARRMLVSIIRWHARL